MGEEVDLFCYEDMSLSPMQAESQTSQVRTETTIVSPKLLVRESPSSATTTSPTRTSSEHGLTGSTLTRRGRPKRKRVKPSKEISAASNPDLTPKTTLEENDSSLLHNYQYLAYNWDDLNLGSSLGSKAYNRYVNYLQGLPTDADSSSSLTATQMHQLIGSLNPKFVLPPPDSNLNRYNLKKRDVVKNDCSQDSDGKLDISMAIKAPMDKFARVYQLMREQQADDDLATRRRIHFMTADAVRNEIKSIENEICMLTLREENMRKRARKLGLQHFK